MSQIKHTFYTVLSDNINAKIILISDLHYSNKNDMVVLNSILNDIKNIDKIDYICIAGDFLDQANISDEILLINWYNQLSSIAPIIISLGNHDVVIRNKKTSYYFNQKLIYDLKQNKNIHILDNECYVDGKIRFIGITPPYDYYYKYKENNNYFIRYINNIFKKPYQDKYNILLSHSPTSIVNDQVQKRVKLFTNIQLAFSGHMHGGLVPDRWQKYFKGVGLISPCKKLFPKNSYGMINGINFNTIISTGIQKIHFTGRLKKTNDYFNREIAIIDIVSEK